MAQKRKIAVAYLRVSSKGQKMGTGLDRQKETVKQYARRAGCELIEFYEEAYTGGEADRPDFTRMLEHLLSNSCRTIIVESLDRLARELTVQLQLVALLASKGITLISATTGQDVTAAMQEDPMMRAMIQIQGVFAELDKNLLVGKLAKARKLKKERTGRCEGRKPFGTRPGEAEVLKRMKHLYRKPRGGERLGFHPIAMQLNREGLSTRSGKPWSAVTVKRILTR